MGTREEIGKEARSRKCRSWGRGGMDPGLGHGNSHPRGLSSGARAAQMFQLIVWQRNPLRPAKSSSFLKATSRG